MAAETLYELIGYLGSVLIVVSLAMSSIIRLRIINLIGALVFTAYGALIGSLPVMLTNLVIAGLDVWFLWRELSTREELTVVSVDAGDAFLREFVELHRGDLETYVEIDAALADADTRLVMLRNANIAGVFLGADRGDGVMEVLLDYVAKPYRDLKSGACLYVDGGTRFTALGLHALQVRDVDSRQARYFEAMGFAAADAGILVKALDGSGSGG